MGLLNLLFGTTPPSPRPREASVKCVGTRTISGKRLERIERSPNFFAENGWRVSGDTLKGRYRALSRAYDGKVENFRSSSPDFFIFNPPQELLDGPHGPCYRERAKDCYLVHWLDRPNNVDSGILKIEHDLKEALSCQRSESYGAF